MELAVLIPQRPDRHPALEWQLHPERQCRQHYQCGLQRNDPGGWNAEFSSRFQRHLEWNQWLPDCIHPQWGSLRGELDFWGLTDSRELEHRSRNEEKDR